MSVNEASNCSMNDIPNAELMLIEKAAAVPSLF
jgi:hypothetical protein